MSSRRRSIIPAWFIRLAVRFLTWADGWTPLATGDHHPEVTATDWCGEWKPRLDDDKEKTPNDKR